MVKKLIILIVAVFYLSAASGFLTVYVGFLLNKNFIATELCVKKDIDNNSCKGNCHVKKELKKEAEKKSSPLSINVSENKYESLPVINVLENYIALSKEKYLTLLLKKETSSNILPEIPPPEIFSY